MWLVNLPKKKGLWAAQGTPHVFVRKSPCSNHRPRHHSWEWLLFSCTPAEASIPADKISGYTHLLPHAVPPSFIFLTPGWKWKSKAYNQNRKNRKMWENWVMYLHINVCHNPLHCWFRAASNRNPNKTAAWIAIYMFMLLPDHWRQSKCKTKMILLITLIHWKEKQQL